MTHEADATDDDDQLLLHHSNSNLNETTSTHQQRCPTCQGTGHVAQSSGLVALIPVDDVRLKRRHTFLWILLTIIFCTLIASVVIAVLLPRSVHLSLENSLVIDATNDTHRNQSVFRLYFVHHTLIRSDNWVPIRLINQTVDIEHQLIPVGNAIALNFGHKMYLRPLGRLPSNISVTLNFEPNTMAYRVCHGIFRQMLLFKVHTQLTYADFLLGRVQTTSDTSYQYVLCNRGDWSTDEIFGEKTFSK